jgi:hypothetical protein
MQGAWPARQNERPLTLPKGWTQVTAAYQHKVALHYWDTDGSSTRWRRNTRWDHATASLGLAHGLSRHILLWVDLPVLVHARLRNDFGTDTAVLGFGDARAGLRVQPWHFPTWNVAFEVNLKTPSGSEWPGNYQGGAAGTSTFLLGTGTTNVGAAVYHRFQLGTHVVAADVDLGGAVKLPSVTGYVLEDGGFGNGWLDPGDEFWAHAALAFQLGLDVQIHGNAYVQIHGNAWVSHRGPYRIGVSGESAFRTELDRIPNSSGTFFDAGFGASWEPFDELELRANARANLLGADTTLFGHLGLEEFSPQPGWTFGGAVVGRW